MTQQDINFGTSAARDGETLFSAFTKIQQNFDELYASIAVDALTELALADDAADYLSIYDTSAATWKKLLGKNLGFTQAGTGALLRPLQGRLQERISVLDFVPASEHAAIIAYTSTTDLTTYVNAAFARLRTLAGANTDAARFPVSLVFPPGRYTVTSINATDILSRGWSVYGEGAVIVGNGAGKVIFDLLHSRWGSFYNITLRGDTSSVPRVGFQVGYKQSNVSAGSHNFFGCQTAGNFSLAAFANFGSEVTYTWGCEFRNLAVTSDSYCLVHDSANYWDVTTDYSGGSFVSLTLADDTAYSLVMASHHGSQFQKLAGGSAIWVGPGSVEHVFTDCYAYSLDAAPVVLYTDTSIISSVYCHRGLKLGIRCEGVGSTCAVQFVRHGNSSPRFPAFTFHGQESYGSSAVFLCSDGFTGTIYLIGADIELNTIITSPTNGFFHTASIFVVTGRINCRDADGDFKGMPSIYIGDVEASDANKIVYGVGTYTVNAPLVAGVSHDDTIIKGGYHFYSSPGSTVAIDGLTGTSRSSIDGSGLFLSAAGAINWASGGVTITESSDELLFAGAATYRFGASIRPTSNDSAPLGAATVSWADLFLASGALINWNNGTYTLTQSSAILTASGSLVAAELRASGDVGGAASQNALTNVSDVTANSTGVGTILFKGTTSRDSTGFIKIYVGTTAYYIPVFSAISG
jgi:hypothetical protein